MGKVFTWNERRHHRVPTLGSFATVVEMLRVELSRDLYLGAVVLGSVVQGTHTIRSDIDCLVLYREDYKETAQIVLGKLKAKSEALYVPLDFAQLTPQLAASPIHAVGTSFAHHASLMVERGGLIGRNPLEYVHLWPIDMKAEAANWCRQKYRRIDDNIVSIMTSSDVDDARFMTRLLETPINGVRKLLLLDGDFEDDSKAAVMSMTAERYPDLYPQLEALVALDREYDAHLQEQLASPTQSAVGTMHSRIRCQAGMVQDLLRQIQWEIERC